LRATVARGAVVHEIARLSAVLSSDDLDRDPAKECVGVVGPKRARVDSTDPGHTLGRAVR
ncbi:MAG TPA: hypothetical protein VG815_00775, partial [Chloroflexota bacterium]|nr:hypothetical protein [Chloroflexota bacterium]